jgi:hypothetical protein
MAGLLWDGSPMPEPPASTLTPEEMTEEQLTIESHLVELEAQGFTIVDDAIPPALLARLRANHKQIIKRVRETKPPERHSWESPKPGVVDAFRLYALDEAYAALLTLPKVFPIIDRAIREGRGRPGHPGGPRLYHEMMQHHPAGTEGGQSWHRDGDLLRCTFTLNDLPPSPIGVRKTVLFVSFMNAIILPRQARDKHREHSKKEYRFIPGRYGHSAGQPPRRPRRAGGAACGRIRCCVSTRRVLSRCFALLKSCL